ncbi:LOW QUALITY PROTEIN: FBLN1 isoform 17, partial [Pongo abelii]
ALLAAGGRGVPGPPPPLRVPTPSASRSLRVSEPRGLGVRVLPCAAPPDCHRRGPGDAPLPHGQLGSSSPPRPGDLFQNRIPPPLKHTLLPQS